MSKIKTREVVKGTIKTLDKGVVATQKTKDNLVNVKSKSENAYKSNETNANEYATNKINNTSRVVIDNSGKIKQKGNKAVKDTKQNYIKTKAKIKNVKIKLAEKRKVKETTKGIKTSSKVAKKEAQKVAKETVKVSQRARKVAQETAKKTYQGAKAVVKATVSTVKAIIAGTKALISVLIAGGWVALIVIVVICLIGLLCSSIFGIFLSSEKTSADSVTMKEVIAECSQEFTDKLENIQNSNAHDEYVLDGSMASWKDVLLVYAVKQSKGNNENEVITITDEKKSAFKEIFWDMNELSYEVREETVTEQGVNTDEMPKEVDKNVLHINIKSKTVDEMKTLYSFNNAQEKQIAELSDPKYASLWNGVVYGLQDSGEYINWRQKGATWSNIRIGNTTSTIGNIGCLVTSVAILIEKSGVNTNLTPFNPGTFVEALNKNGGFDGSGNLQYGAIKKVVPEFRYVGNINLREKTRQEKLALITQYFNQGYYLTVEVKGATPGNQHWVAIVGINGNDVMMVDPASNQTIMWNAYNYSKSSQFNYFKAN